MGNFIAIGKTTKLLSEYPPHAHAEWELVLYTRGPGMAWSGARAFPFTEGTFIANPPGIPHRERAARGYSNIACLVHDVRLPAHEAFVGGDPEHRPLRHLAELLDREYHLKRSAWERTCEELLGVFLHFVAQLEREPARQSPVARMENVLVDNIQNPDFSVEEALGGFGLSRFHFMRLFKKATGRSPLQYLIDLRIHSASNLLKTTRLTVEEVGHQVGLIDPYYFSRLFRKKTGQSPQAFRRGAGGVEGKGQNRSGRGE